MYNYYSLKFKFSCLLIHCFIFVASNYTELVGGITLEDLSGKRVTVLAAAWSFEYQHLLSEKEESRRALGSAASILSGRSFLSCVQAR